MLIGRRARKPSIFMFRQVLCARARRANFDTISISSLRQSSPEQGAAHVSSIQGRCGALTLQSGDGGALEVEKATLKPCARRVGLVSTQRRLSQSATEGDRRGVAAANRGIWWPSYLPDRMAFATGVLVALSQATAVVLPYRQFEVGFRSPLHTQQRSLTSLPTMDL